MSKHAKDTRSHPIGAPLRHDHVLELREHDAYKAGRKLPEPTACPDCHAVFHQGRWQWAEQPADAHLERCPACHRIHDQFPAGFVTIGGDYFKQHRDELLNLVAKVGEQAWRERPLERIMAIAEQPDGGVVVTTTDSHLARGIGEALHHAAHGELKFRYVEEDNLLRVHWQR
ncbi:NMD3 family protein [mine drainage metagenome]|uniref:NMD3 family protein n=1 Tax=mine drainage metagenome TaxID=410659 RepID=A0A1J5S3A8_9ZZZZ